MYQMPATSPLPPKEEERRAEPPKIEPRNHPRRLSGLFASLVSAQRQQKLAEAAVGRIEKQILEALTEAGVELPEEGSKTTAAPGWKVTVTTKINRTLDKAAWNVISKDLEPNFYPVEHKPSVSAMRCKWLKANRPDIWREVSKAVTEKPGKPSIKLTEAPEEEPLKGEFIPKGQENH